MLEGGGRARDSVCRRCVHYQEPDTELFTNTWIGGSTKVSKRYLAYRWTVGLLVSLFLVHAVAARLQHTAAPLWKFFLYLTSWARLLAATHYLAEAALVTRRWRAETLAERRETAGAARRLVSSYASTRSRLPASHRALWAAANINADTAALCSLLYWTFLYDGSRGLDVDNISGHVLICVVNAVDIFVSQRPWRVLHVYHAQLFCLVYVMSNFAYIEGGGTNTADQPYIYSVLDWSKPTVCIVTILGVLLILPFIHCIFILLYRVRCMVASWSWAETHVSQSCEVELVQSHSQSRLLRAS